MTYQDNFKNSLKKITNKTFQKNKINYRNKQIRINRVNKRMINDYNRLNKLKIKRGNKMDKNNINFDFKGIHTNILTQKIENQLVNIVPEIINNINDCIKYDNEEIKQNIINRKKHIKRLRGRMNRR